MMRGNVVVVGLLQNKSVRLRCLRLRSGQGFWWPLNGPSALNRCAVWPVIVWDKQIASNRVLVLPHTNHHLRLAFFMIQEPVIPQRMV